MSFRRWRVFLVFHLLSLALVGLEVVHGAEDEWALGVRTTEPRTPAEQREHFKLPPGFEIQLVAAEPDLNKPLNLAFDATGRLWVTTSIEYPWAAPTNRPARDRLMIFEDFGPDGRARKVTQFADGLNIPIGIYPFRSPARSPSTVNSPTLTWKAIVWSIPNIWLLEDTDGDGRADAREILYGPFDTTRDTHGNLASFRRGFDGWLYGTHGYNNNSWITNRDGLVVHLNSGNTWRARLDGSHLERHTHGQVNPFGLAWDSSGNLYSSDCHSAPIYQLLTGGYYPSFGKPHDGLGFAPVMLEHAHGSTAIDGAFYYTDDLWPAEYQNMFLIGNVMTSRLNRDQITFIGSTPKATEQPDFLTTSDPWFRPVDTTLGPDGALYVADFYNRIIGHYEVPLTHPGRDRERGRIWRVVYRGSDGAAKLRPPALADELDGLVVELSSPNLSRRLLAMTEIQNRFATPAVPRLKQALAHPANAFQHVHALWLLQRLGQLDESVLAGSVASPDALIRTHAQRVITERSALAETRSPGLRPLALRGLADPEALVCRCAAEALGQAPAFDNLRPLLDTLARIDRADSHLVYVLRLALRDQLKEDAILARVLDTTWSARDSRALADVALAVKSPLSGKFVLQHLDSFEADNGQLAAALEHAARYAPEADLPQVASYAKAKYANDLNWRLTVFEWMRTGLDQRGAEMPAGVRDWGAELAHQALDSLDPNSLGWTSSLLEGVNGMAPWKFEMRPSADGKTLTLLSSFPLGERSAGVLRSPVFLAPKQFSFWLSGHDGPPDQPAKKQNIVRLRRANESSAVLAEAAPPRNDTAQKITWDLAAFEGQPVFLEVTDGDTGSAYAWLAIGRFEPAVLTLPAVPPAEMTQRRAFAGKMAAQLNLTELAPSLRAILNDPQAGRLDRANAALGLLTLEPDATTQRLTAILGNDAESVTTRGELGAALAEINSAAARQAIVAALKTAPYRTQARWMKALVANREGADVVLRAVEQGIASPQLLRDAVELNLLAAANPPDWKARYAKLTEDLPPADQAREKLVAARRNAYAPTKAQVAEGRRVFEVNCVVCHQLDGQGGLIAPQLTGIGNRGPERLCEDILDPNRNVDLAFRQTILTRKDGEVLSGLFRREEGELLVFADATGKEFTVRKSEVADRHESDQSLMPDNFGESISEPDFNNLLAFLLAHRSP